MMPLSRGQLIGEAGGDADTPRKVTFDGCQSMDGADRQPHERVWISTREGPQAGMPGPVGIAIAGGVARLGDGVEYFWPRR